MKSRLLLRETFRDWFANKLSFEDALNIEMVVKANKHFLKDNHPQTMAMLQYWSEGYNLYELSEKLQIHPGIARDALRFAFELLGRKLEISDGSVLDQVPPQLHTTANSVFMAYYDTFTELPERDLEL